MEKGRQPERKEDYQHQHNRKTYTIKLEKERGGITKKENKNKGETELENKRAFFKKNYQTPKRGKFVCDSRVTLPYAANNPSVVIAKRLGTCRAVQWKDSTQTLPRRILDHRKKEGGDCREIRRQGQKKCS